MKIYELQALYKATQKAKRENGFLGICTDGDFGGVQLNKEKFVELFGIDTRITKVNTHWERFVWVDDVRFFTCIYEYNMDEQDKEDIKFWGCY